MSSPSSRTAGLDVAGLSKSYGPRPLIRDATFSLEPGEIVCLTGDNGAGKSTLLRCLVGLTRYGGSATLDGMSLTGDAATLRRIGFVPQTPTLVDTASVAETLELFASLRRITFEPGLLPDGWLPPVESRIAHLSGGQRQRVALSIALLGSPTLLLLDEPTANLDDAGRSTITSLIQEAAKNGCAVLIVSPAAIDLAPLVRRVLTLSDGHVVPGDAVYTLIRRQFDNGRSSADPIRTEEALSWPA